MCSIDGVASLLDSRGAIFTVESLAKELKQAWIEEALAQAERESIRERLLPAPLTMWFVILMGLYRRTSYVNLLEKLMNTWWTRHQWPEDKPPCTRAVTKARDRVGIRLLTDLMPESGFTHDELADLYHDRWEEETINDEIKTHLCECATVNRPVVFRSQTPDRVVQELWGMLTAYNAVRKTMCAAAVKADRDPLRVSFTSALDRIREATYDMMRMPTIRLAGRYDEMIRATARVLVPKRPGRHVPRAVKIKMSSYPRNARYRLLHAPMILDRAQRL
jgi:hypothetical protein